jgi:hypothetical protein
MTKWYNWTVANTIVLPVFGEAMSNARSTELARRARAIYDSKLRATLTTTNADDFVAIEPESGDFFVGETLSSAIQAARAAYPDRLPFTLRIGHESTVELGVML